MALEINSLTEVEKRRGEKENGAPEITGMEDNLRDTETVSSREKLWLKEDSEYLERFI